MPYGYGAQGTWAKPVVKVPVEENEHAIKPTEAEIAGVMNQNRKDPIVIALAGKIDTNKSGILCEFISKLPAGKMCPILDFDHSIIPIIDRFYSEHRDKFIVINGTSCGKDYRRGLKIALAALEKVVLDNKDNIGLLASEGMDRLLQRSFKITCQARGYNIEDLRFFGKGGSIEFSPTDWMIRNDYNVDPFDLMYNVAADCGVDLILTTHTEDKINSKHEITKIDEPMWFKTIPDYVSYMFILKQELIMNGINRVAVIEKARMQPELKGRKIIVSSAVSDETGMIKAEFKGLYDQVKPLINIHF